MSPEPAPARSVATTVAHERLVELPDLGSLLREFGAWLRHNLGETIVLTVIGAAASYLINTYVMVVQENGYYAYGYPDTVTTGPNNLLSGGAFWGLLSMVVFGVWGYARAVGSRRLVEDVKNFPREIATLLRRDGHPARVHLLWGAAGGLLGSQLLLPASCAVLGLGAVAAVPSVLGKLVTGFLQRVISTLTGKIAPTRGHEVAGMIAVVVGMAGGALALLIGSLVSDHWLRLGLTAIAGVAAFLLGRTGRVGPAVGALLALGGGMLVIWAGHPAVVRADDGGWIECGSNLQQWITYCPNNVGDLLYGLVAVPPAMVGTVIGGFLGAYAGAAAKGTAGPWWQRPGEPRPAGPEPSGPSGPDRGASKYLKKPIGQSAAEMEKSRDAARRHGAGQSSQHKPPVQGWTDLMGGGRATGPLGPHGGGGFDAGRMSLLQDALRKDIGSASSGWAQHIAAGFPALERSMGLPAVPLVDLVPIHAAQVVGSGTGSDLGYTLVGTAHSMFHSTREAVEKRRARELAAAVRAARTHEEAGPPARRLAMLRPAQGEYGGLSAVTRGLFQDLARRRHSADPTKEGSP